MSKAMWPNMLGALLAIVPLLCPIAAEAGDVLIYDFASPYLQRMDRISPGAGDAKEVNTVTHMVNPWPPYVGNRHIPANADRMVDAYERYRDVSKLPCAPPPLAPVRVERGLFAGGSGDGGGGGGGGGTNCLSTSSPSPNGGATPGK